ncbi:cation:proton antiporter [Rhizobium sp. CG4]|jgi:multicomponent K+:H+ antiporter subunit G|uniref:monovalent cation/H(+) antiporter subunit G n=1 Tax=Rhizobium/Agrobacterium group TaxID=227290 RepID=UPI001785CF5A|nr:MULTISPECIES: monovalent cation/H(+) antiporter subunit G [Rhizobium/Agrobacterium group]MBD9385800.1 cation:proton antiporter [Agrobacterium sp. AGB01]MCM2456010.1 cation:proton antiporter [Rhizobium sp. CG4]MCS4243692.1 multicomponent K+:H+ antiporter subunit G [Rhizobium sp. BIGb0125]MDO5894306.1 monovalent cation/H(+) antiporter subunit G [Agrobacterium sp. Azo12]
MSEYGEFPLWAAIAVAFFILLGSSLALIGTIGFAQLNSFYERLHAPTLGTSWGTGGIVMASIIYFSVSEGRFAFHEIFIGIFMTVTTPVSLMLLGRAALYRDRTEQNTEVRNSLDDEQP